MSEISISELDDEPGKVYVIGLGSEQPESVRRWFYQEKGEGGFNDWWNERFQHADSLVLPTKVEMAEVKELEEAEVREMMNDE